MMLSLIVKVTVTTALALLGAHLARGRRAALRHAMLAASFGVLLLMPVVAMLAPPVRIAVPAAPIPVVRTVAAYAPMPPAIMPTDFPTRRPTSISFSSLLLPVWIFGSALCLLPMFAGLWQVRKLRRSAIAWRRDQSGVEILLSDQLTGPVTCGALHPAIILPVDAQTWSEADLNRALVHELEHVRRRDWIVHCLARATCALYWFHPLMWIAQRQLALEAERACDDAVLSASEATAYADQLVGLARRLSTTKSPLLAMANRTDLTTRVSAVLNGSQLRGRAGRLIIAVTLAAGLLLVLTISPLTTAAAPQDAAMPEFEAVSVKLIDPALRGQQWDEDSDAVRVNIIGSMHGFLVRFYGLRDEEIKGEPDWFRTRLYNISAVKATPFSGEQQKMLMLRRVLAERFQLKLREEDRDLPILVLQVAPGGPKFHELKPGATPAKRTHAPDAYGRNFESMDQLVNVLNGAYFGEIMSDRRVVDRTGLTGKYDMYLETPRESQNDEFGYHAPLFPDLMHDVQSQLGLKLVPDHAKIPCYVVESAAAPSAN